MDNQTTNRNINMSRFHLLEPDFKRPVFELAPEHREKILEKLLFLYEDDDAKRCCVELERILKVYYAYKSKEMIEWEKGFDHTQRFTEQDIVLITYGDFIQSKTMSPLETLSRFCKKYLNGAISTIHVLPFFPYSSDRGFSVIDFEEVDPRIGKWDDIENLKTDFKLMFDGIFNHASSKSRWFQEFLNGNPEYKDFFLVFSTKDAIPEDYLKLIVRPRTTELLSEYYTLRGKRWVWTTFSKDQVDINYKNPKVLLKIVEILLTYVRRGADIIRLDAITYLWMELGTSCATLKQTHVIIELFRIILNAVAPHVSMIAEANISHEDNITYLGNGNDEAQMIYNFALPPLVLHSFQTGSTKHLTKWASSLQKVSNTATYFNFLDSHDGIGLLPVKNILSTDEINLMTLRAIEHGGFVSYSTQGDGTQTPYEINITWYSAMNRDDSKEDDDLQIKRFIASRSIALAMMGVPGIYLHSLLGSKNDADAVLEEQQTRSINRKVLDEDCLLKALNDHGTTSHKVAKRFGKILVKRRKEKAFHPNADQKIIDISDGVFALIRSTIDKKEHILSLTNVTNMDRELEIDHKVTGIRTDSWFDILNGKKISSPEGRLFLTLKPYDFFWLKVEEESN